MSYQVLLCNSFSINMLNTELIRAQKGRNIRFEPITRKEAATRVKNAIGGNIFSNVIGHSTSDVLVREQLEREIDGLRIPKGKRKTVKLAGQELVIIAQYEGERLEEGATTLPRNSVINYWLIIV